MKTITMLKGAACLLCLTAGTALADPATYATPEAAVAAFVDALNAQDQAALLTVFGPESEDLISSGNPREDAKARAQFLADYQEIAQIVDDGEGRKELQVGRTRWPFPVTLVAVDGGWRFDPAAAREEILDRRIGANELDVIALLQRARGVQAAYRQVDYDGDGVMEFASSILSDPGTRDGLYWPDEPGAPQSPIGPFIAQAAADGISLDGVDQPPEPYFGYYYRILTKQGPAAPGGAYDYMVGGHMLAGYALLAYPAEPEETGVMTFMMGENGVIYEADLGENTLDIAGKIEAFDPDPAQGWKPLAGQ
ncbi:DUF2950 domain-containing protein [Neotabrizicola shimadae]|uniref:DUF2950 domain-containing protein n=1 Tax=Neotabrizicola shimadae TaxID=2807096 RepID=A0A8G0ZU66_9RHOB|nr:DUF2950 domain-containing protein [Neotabrizicola shimadae]QYZ68154.1 DUF2950 domain-containing protein [Neotabrizicola shimadae]